MRVRCHADVDTDLHDVADVILECAVRFGEDAGHILLGPENHSDATFDVTFQCTLSGLVFVRRVCGGGSHQDDGDRGQHTAGVWDKRNVLHKGVLGRTTNFGRDCPIPKSHRTGWVQAKFTWSGILPAATRGSGLGTSRTEEKYVDFRVPHGNVKLLSKFSRIQDDGPGFHTT